MFAGKKSAQIREILISESAWEEMTCLFAPSLKFRKINSLESLEKLFDHLNYTLSDNQEIINMYRAADHRRAELVSGGRLFNVGEVPKSVWRYVL